MKNPTTPWIVQGNCPAGGNHVRGTSGQWAGRCTKCGAPC